MSVFFFDSDCELWWTEAKKLNAICMQMPYTIGDVFRGYDLGEKTDFKEYFTKMKNGEVPTTQALNPYDYIEHFEPYLKKGEDILYVHFSNKLSGTFVHLQTAIDELKVKYPDRKITTVDTLSISGAAGSIVKEAAELHNSGATDEEVVKFVEKNREHFAEYFMVEDLKYLKRGGRISSITAIVGTMLNVKPILKVDSEGKIVSIGKAIGRKKGVAELINYFVKLGEDVENHQVIIMQAECEDDAEAIAEKLKQINPKVKPFIQPIGPVIGCHCGPGTVGIIFHSKGR